MKPVRCSWVDMQKVRASLSGGKRGDQAALLKMRCVDKVTVSNWKAAVDVLDAMGEVSISELSTFQPSHATELARHMRKAHGKNPADWDREEVLDWVELCESKELTVEQFKAALQEQKPKDEPVFMAHVEGDAIRKWLLLRRESWPEPYRKTFTSFVGRILETINVHDRGQGEDTADAGDCAA